MPNATLAALDTFSPITLTTALEIVINYHAYLAGEETEALRG